MREKSTRFRRIAGLIQTVIANALKRDVNDPRLQHVSICGIDMAPDLGQAVLFFTMAEPTPENIKSAEKAFRKASGFFRSLISQSTELRYTPQLFFKYDASIVHAEKIQRLLDDIEDDQES
jgi:ribosome-binding factor A